MIIGLLISRRSQAAWPWPSCGLRLFESLRQLLHTALELAQVELELLVTDLQLEKLRLVEVALRALLGLLLLGLGLLLLIGFLLVGSGTAPPAGAGRADAAVHRRRLCC